MSEIEVGFRAVLRHENFPVLIGAHGAGIDVDIRVEFLRGDLQPARFQKPPEARRGDAFAQPRNDAARYEYVFCHTLFSLIFYLFIIILPRAEGKRSENRCDYTLYKEGLSF